MIGQRSIWIAARARNAARKGGWIAAFGGVAVLVTLLVLVAVPREADKQLRRRIDALPEVPDSLPISRRLDSLRRTYTASRPVAPRRDSLPSLTTDSATAAQGNSAVDSATTEALADLFARLQRVRQVPLFDSYRALAGSPLLATDPRVAVVRDSLEIVERERETFAALGGPGARYAALTARMSVLGQELVRIAEARLGPAAVATAGDSAGLVVPVPSVDSARRDSLARRMVAEESLLVVARQRLAARDTQRLQMEARLTVPTPPIAMVLAALVIGVAVGYGAVLVRELRRPTVGDAAEVERLTGATVLVHARETPSTLVERSRLRERPGVPRIIDRDSDTFALLHLALTGVGDVVSQADVLADAPLIGAAVALGTAAAAARESRAVLVVEATRHRPLLARLVNAKVRHTIEDVCAGRVSPDDAVHVVTLDRDARIDVLVAALPPAGRSGLFRRRPAPSVPSVRSSPRAAGANASANAGPAAGGRGLGVDRDGRRDEALRSVAAQYDLVLQLPAADGDEWPAARDVIVCARQGSTPLAWLVGAAEQAQSRRQRLRAVVMWSRDMPTV